MNLGLKIVLVLALVAAGWHSAGPIGLAFVAPAIGVAFSKNLIEFWESAVRAMRKHAYEGDERVYKFGFVQLRMVMRHGRPWFAAHEVCGALGYEDVDEAIRHLAASEHEGIGGSRIPYLPEAAVDKLAARSRHPDAVRFRIWFERDVMYPIKRAREQADTGRTQT